MDLRIDNEEGKFKFRVCGILKHNNKFLAVKMDENNFFCLPGGHVELGEDTDQAILREMKEELGFEIKISKLVCVIQNFFKTKTEKIFHELGYYYIVEPVNKSDVNPKNYTRQELDKGELKQLEFRWFTFEELQKEDFKPEILKDKLLDENFQNVIVRD